MILEIRTYRLRPGRAEEFVELKSFHTIVLEVPGEVADALAG